MKQVAASYAGALLALAESPAQAQTFEDALDAFTALYKGSTPLREFLCNPVAPRAAQRDILARLAPPSVPQSVLNCLYVMVDKGRIAQLPQVAEAYRRHLAVLTGTLLIHVYSPNALDETETQRICEVFTKRFGAADASVEVSIDSQLIGGVRVQIGDILFDESLQGRLKGLERAIHEQKQYAMKTDGE